MQQRPKAYLFDVFGTVVNWRHSLAKGLEASARKVIEGTSTGVVDEAVLARARSMTFSDWEWFAFQWSRYQRYIDSDARPKETGDREAGKPATFIPQEELHRRNLDTLITEFQLDGLWTTSDQTAQLLHLWHELDAWPDSAAAIARFAKLGPSAALSDGPVALLTSLDARNGLRFSEVWGRIRGGRTSRTRACTWARCGGSGSSRGRWRSWRRTWGICGGEEVRAAGALCGEAV
ncbi:haloacid dehalogenase [Apiospora hydei]|uniref:Haloacid dehalogenase n=1 Tax=Apiospora hydei TaxID=1337664 RepID=A0ABR1UTY2_9PEZI